MSITTAQIRGARGILNWSQQDLAKRTGISATSIGSIENGITSPRESTLTTIQNAFEANGIEFLGLEGVRVRSNYMRTYKGQKGFREFLDHLYDTAKTQGGDIVLFNAYPPHWYKWAGEDFFKMHSKRMKDLGDFITVRITSKNENNLFISRDFAEYRWFPDELFNDRAVYSYGSFLAFVNFEEDDVTVYTLRQEEFSQAFKVLFDIAWKKIAIEPKEAA